MAHPRRWQPLPATVNVYDAYEVGTIANWFNFNPAGQCQVPASWNGLACDGAGVPLDPARADDWLVFARAGGKIPEKYWLDCEVYRPGYPYICAEAPRDPSYWDHGSTVPPPSFWDDVRLQYDKWLPPWLP